MINDNVFNELKRLDKYGPLSQRGRNQNRIRPDGDSISSQVPLGFQQWLRSQGPQAGNISPNTPQGSDYWQEGYNDYLAGWNSKFGQNQNPGPMPPPANPGTFGRNNMNMNQPRPPFARPQNPQIGPRPSGPGPGSGGPRTMSTPSMGNVLSGRGNTGPGRFNNPLNKKGY